jgi:hypothetical protein
MNTANMPLAWLAEKQEAAERRHRWIVVGTVAGIVATIASVIAACPRCHRLSARMAQLTLKRASASRPSGEWKDDDFDVLGPRSSYNRIRQFPGRAIWMWKTSSGL